MSSWKWSVALGWLVLVPPITMDYPPPVYSSSEYTSLTESNTFSSSYFEPFPSTTLNRPIYTSRTEPLISSTFLRPTSTYPLEPSISTTSTRSVYPYPPPPPPIYNPPISSSSMEYCSTSCEYSSSSSSYPPSVSSAPCTSTPIIVAPCPTSSSVEISSSFASSGYPPCPSTILPPPVIIPIETTSEYFTTTSSETETTATCTSGASSSIVPSPWIFALPGVANVTSSPSNSESTTSEPCYTPTETDTVTIALPTPVNQVNVTAKFQAFVFYPPNVTETPINPYQEPLGFFKNANLRLDQEQRLANRSFYFQSPYLPGAQIFNFTLGKKSYQPSPSVPGISPIDVFVNQSRINSLPVTDAQMPPYPDQASMLLETLPNGVFNGSVSFQNLPAMYVPVLPEGEYLMNSETPADVTLWQSSASIQRSDFDSCVDSPNSDSNNFLVMFGNASNAEGYEVQQFNAPINIQPQQFAVFSEIDNTLRSSNNSSPYQSLSSVFTDQYWPVFGMPDVLWSWNATNGGSAPQGGQTSFHYFTGLPIPLAPSMMEFLLSWYPGGSLTMRPTTNLDILQISNYMRGISSSENDLRFNATSKVLDTFPNATGIIVSDTSKTKFNATLRLLAEYPTRITCIYLRNLTQVQNYTDLMPPLNASFYLTRQEAVQLVEQQLYQSIGNSSIPPVPIQANRLVNGFSNPMQLKNANWTQGRCL